MLGRIGRSSPVLLVAGALFSPSAARAQTQAQAPAGAIVRNVAEASIRDDGADRIVRSNEVAIRIAERLDVALLAVADPAAVGAGAVPIRLRNDGNGTEAFDIVATDGAGSVRGVAHDRDGNGRYDPAVDGPLRDGRAGPLDPGATTTLFVLVYPSTRGPVTVRATAATGSGAPGTTFVGAGDGGGEAVVGPSGASAELSVTLGEPVEPTLVKSQAVLAPDGTTIPVSGAIVTYAIVATFPGAADAATLVDPIPAGARYVAGSLTLDDVPLSDADDADPGTASGDGVRVALGRIATPTTHRIRFRVQLK